MTNRTTKLMQLDPEFHHKELKGQRVGIDTGEGNVVNLVLGRLDRRAEAKLVDEGFALVVGEIITASGHRFHAMLDLCVQDSCEHYSTIVYALDGEQVIAVQQGQPEFYDWVDSMKAAVPGFEMFPYKYRYRDTQLRSMDHHVGDDGWSLA